MGYEPRMPSKDGPVITVMRDLSSQYPRYGYRRIHIFLARLAKLISEHGAPQYLRSGNGPEFVSKAVLKWLQSNIDTALIDPGKPLQNGDDESFNGNFRDECLSLESFRNRT